MKSLWNIGLAFQAQFSGLGRIVGSQPPQPFKRFFHRIDHIGAFPRFVRDLFITGRPQPREGSYRYGPTRAHGMLSGCPRRSLKCRKQTPSVDPELNEQMEQ